MTDTALHADLPPEDATAAATLPDGQALAAMVAGKLCHDFISPAGAIRSGLGMMKDPSMQDMRDDALSMIEASAIKMVALVAFARVAFGAATSSERFSLVEVRTLVDDLTHGGRATLVWQGDEADLSKAQARALTNLAYLTVQALPSGGTATVTTRRDGGTLTLEGVAEGNRARLKPEALTGLAGQPLTDGLNGQWIQPYWLWLTAHDAGGTLTLDTTEGRVVLTARMPG